MTVAAPFSSIGGAVELAASALIEAVVTSFVTIFQTLFDFDLRARARRRRPPPPSRTPGTSASRPGHVRDTTEVAASDAAVKREPTPIGALFEGAFRRYGANILGYTLWSAGLGLIPLVVTVLLRDWRDVLFAVVAAQSFAHFLLCAVLTALVTGTLRTRIVPAALVALVCAAVTGAVFVVGGRWRSSSTRCSCSGRSPPRRATNRACGRFRPARSSPCGTGARAFGVLLGLGVIAMFLWFACLIALLPIGGAAQQIATLALTTLMFSPLAALVERNLYGDLTGRKVLPASVSLDQRDRGRRPRR